MLVLYWLIVSFLKLSRRLENPLSIRIEENPNPQMIKKLSLTKHFYLIKSYKSPTKTTSSNLITTPPSNKHSSSSSVGSYMCNIWESVNLKRNQRELLRDCNFYSLFNKVYTKLLTFYEEHRFKIYFSRASSLYCCALIFLYNFLLLSYNFTILDQDSATTHSLHLIRVSLEP